MYEDEYDKASVHGRVQTLAGSAVGTDGRKQTEVAAEGGLYLAAVLDQATRKIVRTGRARSYAD